MILPEEIKRLETDRLADPLLTLDILSSEKLRQEWVPEAKIRFVGNITMDSLEAQRDRLESLNSYEIAHQALLRGQGNLSMEQNGSVRENRFAAMTMHRPSNVDEQKVLTAILDFFDG